MTDLTQSLDEMIETMQGVVEHGQKLNRGADTLADAEERLRLLVDEQRNIATHIEEQQQALAAAVTAFQALDLTTLTGVVDDRAAEHHQALSAAMARMSGFEATLQDETESRRAEHVASANNVRENLEVLGARLDKHREAVLGSIADGGAAQNLRLDATERVVKESGSILVGRQDRVEERLADAIERLKDVNDRTREQGENALHRQTALERLIGETQRTLAGNATATATQTAEMEQRLHDHVAASEQATIARLTNLETVTNTRVVNLEKRIATMTTLLYVILAVVVVAAIVAFIR